MLCLGSIVLTASMVAGQSGDPIPEEVRTQMKYLVGNWQTEGSYGDVQIKGTYSARWAPGRQCLILNNRSGERASTGIGGWDPTAKAYVETWYGSDGLRVEQRFTEMSRREWSGTLTLNRKDKASKGKIKLTKQGRGTYHFKGEADGDPTYEVITRRVKREQGAHFEHLKPLAPLIGKHVFDGPAPTDGPIAKKGTRIKVEVSHRWAFNRNVIVHRGSAEVDGKIVLEMMSLISWDHEKKKIVTHAVNSMGETTHGEMSREEDKITVKLEGRDAKGGSLSATNVIMVLNGGDWSWQGTKQVRDGKEQPNSEVVRLKKLSN